MTYRNLRCDRYVKTDLDLSTVGFFLLGAASWYLAMMSSTFGVEYFFEGLRLNKLWVRFGRPQFKEMRFLHLGRVDYIRDVYLWFHLLLIIKVSYIGFIKHLDKDYSKRLIFGREFSNDLILLQIISIYNV